MLSVNQFWDPLEVCIVGRMYDPSYFQNVQNIKARTVLERIAIECEEDLQKLIKLLESFNVKVLRPSIKTDKVFSPPPIMPRDWTAMIGDTFYIDPRVELSFYQPIIDYVASQTTKIVWQKNVNTATILRFGKDLLCGNVELTDENIWSTLKKDYWPSTPPVLNGKFNTLVTDLYKKEIRSTFSDYRCYFYESENHLDGRMLSPKPGLLIINPDLKRHGLFKDWDILEISKTLIDEIINNSNYNMIRNKNAGKWWVPGEEHNNDFTDFINNNLKHWTGFIEESQYDINMLMIDSQNAVVTRLNDEMAKKLEEHGVTLHVVKFRHETFFDGGIHCLTSDIKRKGKLIDLALLT
jgi:hypothetical protein